MQELLWIFSTISPTDLVDILIVTALFYGVSLLFRGTQAAASFRGLIVMSIVLLVVAGLLRLQALGFLLSSALTVLALAIPVVFQPELRRALEQIGRTSSIFNRQTPQGDRERIIEEVVKASGRLSERRHGGLIVLQRGSSLEDFVRTGVHMDSEVTAELLLTIFWPKTELHDGAVIIDLSGRIASAAAVLPLTASRNLPNPKLGTRHRAALGISEMSDAICVVISEETGKIAITNGGRMVSRLDSERLRTILNAFYAPTPRETKNWRRRLRDWFGSLRSPTRSPQKPGRVSR